MLFHSSQYTLGYFSVISKESGFFLGIYCIFYREHAIMCLGREGSELVTGKNQRHNCQGELHMEHAEAVFNYLPWLNKLPVP